MKLSVKLKISIMMMLMLLNIRLSTNTEKLMITKLNDTKNQSSNNKTNFFRFTQTSSKESKSNNSDATNIFIMNTEVLNSKVAYDKGDYEQEVIPRAANAGTYYSWGFAWWTFLSFPPENAIFGRSSSYWLSKNGVNKDYLEFTFDIPTKLDSMLIEWRLPPQKFKVEFRVQDGGALIPLTNEISKFEKINSDGSKGNYSQVSPNNALSFLKPIFAKAIRVTMIEPLKSRKFSVNKVRFYNIRTTMMIVNQSVDPCNQYCLYINTSEPKDGTVVEAMECLSGMSTADNRELFQYWSDRSVRTYSKKHCLGFDMATHDLILKDCPYYTPFMVVTNADNSLSFKGYESMCIALDTSQSISSNFVNEKTNLKASSEFDKGQYKKENILSKLIFFNIIFLNIISQLRFILDDCSWSRNCYLICQLRSTFR